MTAPGNAIPPKGGRYRWHRRGVVLVVVAAVSVAVLTVLGFFGAWWWVFDVVSALRPQYAVVLTVATCLLVALGTRRLACGVAVTAVLNFVVIAPLWLASPAPPAKGDRLAVHFHNVHGGGDERFATVAEALSSSDADLVFLSEMSARWIELFRDADLPYRLVHPLRRQDHRRVMALSRIPVDAAEPVPLVHGGRSGGIAVDVTVEGRSLRLLAVHVQSPRSAETAAIRDAELSTVGDWVKTQGVPVAVIGDLNATGWSSAFRQLRRDTGLRDSQHGFGLQPTWMVGTGPLMVPIDHVLHDSAVTVVKRSTGAHLGSAHRSLQVVLAWRSDG